MKITKLSETMRNNLKAAMSSKKRAESRPYKTLVVNHINSGSLTKSYPAPKYDNYAKHKNFLTTV